MPQNNYDYYYRMGGNDVLRSGGYYTYGASTGGGANYGASAGGVQTTSTTRINYSTPEIRQALDYDRLIKHYLESIGWLSPSERVRSTEEKLPEYGDDFDKMVLDT